MISAAEAKQLPNYTEPIGDDQYAIIPAVFHQLHCLVSIFSTPSTAYANIETNQNMIRMALDPEHYPSLAPAAQRWSRRGTDRKHDHLLGSAHTSHCIDSIRQTLMCGADISTLVWRRDKEDKLRPEGRVMHTCRNFARVWEWADSHQFRGELNESMFVKGTPIVTDH